ncbi:hypothetical protein [Sphingobium xenophagum]
MEANDRIFAELHEVRLSGRRWRIAMRQSDWERINSDIPADAHFRLRSALEHFCAHGGDNLPEQLFHPVPGAQSTRMEEFVAFGVHVVGRRATEEPVRTFFVTEVHSAAAEAAPAATPRAVQADLPFHRTHSRGAER